MNVIARLPRAPYFSFSRVTISLVRRFVVCWGAFALVAAAGAARTRLAAQDLEYPVKAAFLLNVAKFTEFPASSFERESAPLSICVLGESPFGDTLAQTVAQERAGGHPLEARRIVAPAEAGTCHIVFVPRSQTHRMPEVLAATAARGVVTVGESRDFLAHGGTINLFLEGGRVRFSMKPETVERRGVRFSSHLLRLARTPERPEVRR